MNTSVRTKEYGVIS